MLAALADELGAAPIQHIGKLLVLWRPMPPKDKAEREDRMPGPKVVKVLKFSKSGNHRPQVKKITVLGNQRLAAGGSSSARASAPAASRSSKADVAAALRPAEAPRQRDHQQRLERVEAADAACSAPNDQPPCPARAAAIIGCTAK